ncbi:MAG: trypsin-like peptidase domain-containing protein [Candidatus Polarisedimenticolia bacterium]
MTTRVPLVAALAVVLAAGGAPATGELSHAAAPGPATRDAAAATETPRPDVCPRCGYRCELGWAFCAACGWDLRILIGEQAQARLLAMTRASVGVTAVHRKKGLEDVLSERDFKSIKRYLRLYTGRGKSWATAFPLGRPGLFVTHARIVADAEDIKVRTASNHEHPATLVAVDPPSGIAVLRAEVPGASPLPAADEPLAADADLYAICYPIARNEDYVQYLPVSLHRGRTTATGQSGTFLVSLENLMRTDHSLPPGCLGGPLIDLRGRVAGLILGSPDTGITYGVPIGGLTPVMQSLAAGAPPRRPYFGLGLVMADERRRARFGIEGAVNHPLVAYLVPGSPAAGAGVRAGDLLTAIDGTPVSTVAEAGALLLRGTPEGPVLNLTLLRGAEEVRLAVLPATRPARILLDPVDEFQEALEANLVEVSTGPTAQQGLRIADLVRGGRGEDEDFKEGDLITAVEGKGVRRLESFTSAARAANPHVFGDGRKEPREINVYTLSLDIRTAGGERKRRGYSNLFPESLAPPVY